MRKISLLFLLAVVMAVPSFAQPKPVNDFSVFVAPGYYAHSEFGDSSAIGYGIGYRHAFTDRFALDAAVSRYRQTDAVFINGYQPAIVRFTVRSIPIDVVAQYLFPTEGKWKPYVGGGVHTAIVDSSTYGGSRPFAAEVTGGVTFNFAKSWGVFFEGRQLLSNSDRPDDPSRRASFGLRYRF